MSKELSYQCQSTYGLIVTYLKTVANYDLEKIADLIGEPVEALHDTATTNFIPSTADSEQKLIELFNIALRTNKDELIYCSQNNNSMNTFDLKEAAQFLKMHKATVRQRAASGTIPGAKVGRSWVFLEHDLVTYLRSLYAESASQGDRHRSKKICHSTNETKSTGLISTTTVREYNEQLGLTTS